MWGLHKKKARPEGCHPLRRYCTRLANERGVLSTDFEDSLLGDLVGTIKRQVSRTGKSYKFRFSLKKVSSYLIESAEEDHSEGGRFCF